MRRLLYVLSALFTIVACTPTGNDSCVYISRLDRAIAEYPTASTSRRKAITDSFAEYIRALRFIYSDSSPADSFLINLGNSRAYRVFQPDVERCLPRLDSLESAFGLIKSNLAVRLPDVQFPCCVAIVSPFRQSVINVDTIMLIGLNHYLGENHHAYNGFDDYIRITKNSRHLPYDAVLSIVSAHYPYSQTTNSNVLSRMIYEGACLYCMQLVIDKWSEKEALGWTDAQLRWATINEAKAWNALISRDLLFSTDPTVAQRLVEPSPSTAILHRDSPGQFGRFIGLRIVESFVRNNPDFSLPELMKPEFYASPSSLSESKYSPK